MNKLVVSACVAALLAIIASTTACLTCNTDQDCGSVGTCQNGTCVAPAPGH